MKFGAASSGAKRLENTRTTFDSRRYYKLLECTHHLPEGSTATVGSEFEEGINFYDIITNGLLINAFWFADSTLLQLDRVDGVKADDLLITLPHIDQDGTDCVQLEISPKSNPRWHDFVLLDATREYVPVKFQQTFDGNSKNELLIKYIPDVKIGWRVSQWTDKQLKPTGDVVVRTCKVTRCSVNEKLEDKLFTIDFPKSADGLSSRGEGATFYIVADDGTEQPITAAEFRARLSKSTH